MPGGSCGSSCRWSAARTGEPVPMRGLLGLPEPSEGDLFLDLEGDPFALDDGVDYLFGILEPGLPEDDPRWIGSRTVSRRRSSTRSGAWTTTGASPGPRRRPRSSGPIDLIMDRWAAGPGHARLPLRGLRADRARAPRAAPRHPRGRGGPPAPRRGAGRPVPGRAPGPARRRRELLHQEDRAAVRAHPGAGPQGRRQQHRRLRDVAGAGRRHAVAEAATQILDGDRRLQPGRRREQLAAARLARGAARDLEAREGRALARARPSRWRRRRRRSRSATGASPS